HLGVAFLERAPRRESTALRTLLRHRHRPLNRGARPSRDARSSSPGGESAPPSRRTSAIWTEGYEPERFSWLAIRTWSRRHQEQAAPSVPHWDEAAISPQPMRGYGSDLVGGQPLPSIVGEAQVGVLPARRAEVVDREPGGAA